VTLIYIFLHKGWFFIPGTNSFTDADPLLGTDQVDLLRRGRCPGQLRGGLHRLRHDQGNPQEIKDLVESVRIPRGAGAAQDH
jgi:cation/acetate symporter